MVKMLGKLQEVTVLITSVIRYWEREEDCTLY